MNSSDFGSRVIRQLMPPAPCFRRKSPNRALVLSDDLIRVPRDWPDSVLSTKKQRKKRVDGCAGVTSSGPHGDRHTHRPQSTHSSSTVAGHGGCPSVAKHFVQYLSLLV